jgi:hypothetical protein
MLHVKALLGELVEYKSTPLAFLKLFVDPILDLHHLHLEFVGLELQD